MDRKSGLVGAVAALLLAASAGVSSAQEARLPDLVQVERIAAVTSYLDLGRELAALVRTDPTNPLIAVMQARLVVLFDAEIQRISAITSPALLRRELALVQDADPGNPLIAIISDRIVVVSSQNNGPTRVAFVDTNPY
jgi:hypothetical protein